MSIGIFMGIVGIIFLTLTASATMLISCYSSIKDMVFLSVPYYDLHKGVLKSHINQKILNGILLFYLAIGTTLQTITLIMGDQLNDFVVQKPYLLFTIIIVVSVFLFIFTWKIMCKKVYDKAVSWYCYESYVKEKSASQKEEYIDLLKEIFPQKKQLDHGLIDFIREKYNFKV